MKSKSLLKNQILYQSLILAILVIGVLCSINQYQKYKEFAFYNNARMLVTEELKRIEACFTNNVFEPSLFKTGNYPVVITDMNGMILYSEKKEFKTSEKLKVNEFLQIDQSLFLNNRNDVKTAFAISIKEKTVGFAAFYIPREEAIGLKEWQVILHIFAPIILCIFLVAVINLTNILFLKHRIIRPVNEMIESSKAIIEGNYNVSVVKSNSKKLMSNDIGKLSYNFELMRDELEEKRKKEEELKKNQKEIISCISHDLKTPISTIKAYSEGLRDGLAKDEEKVLKYAEIIVNKTEVLSKMISDLLEHFNAELNKLTINKKEQYFNDYINQVSKELQKLVEYNHMKFIYDNSAPNLLINIDENRITQVIANLIDNSIKYGKKENGLIKIQVFYEHARKQILINVSDNGYGIGVSDIPFVFDKFYRGEKSRNMSIPGSGLGLSICKYIIEEHSGEIWCESKKDEGTTFMICLPL